MKKLNLIKDFLFFFLFVSIFLSWTTSCTKSDKSVHVYSSIKPLPKVSKQTTPKLMSNKRMYQWKIPKTWKQEALTSMRIASFSATSKDNTNNRADISIIVLGVNAGSLLMNINRWGNQINIKAMSSKNLNKRIMKIKGKLGQFSYIFLKNKKSNQGILASIFYRKNETVFIKMKGSIKTLLFEKNTFIQFSKDLREN